MGVVNTAVVIEERALWSNLKRRFPNEDLSKLHKEVVKNAKGKNLVHVLYEKDGLEQQVVSDDGQVRPRLYNTPELLSALGYSLGYPLELKLNLVVPVANLSIPATPFHESPRDLKWTDEAENIRGTHRVLRRDFR